MSRERGLLPLCFRTGLQIAQVEGLQTEEKSLKGGKMTKVGTHWFFVFLGGGKQAYNLEKLLRRRELGLFTIN